MMKLRKLLAIVLTLLLVAMLFAGCGSVAMDSANPGNGSDLKHESADMSESLAGSAAGGESVTPQNQKLIRTMYLDAETEDMDALLAGIKTRITELNGYVESQEIYNGSTYNSNRYRRASMTIRIPAESLDLFVSRVGEVSNITSNRETTDDITLRYVATESRITALETEQTRLLELLAKAESMDDLLMIESRLTEVRTELEQVTSQLRLYDNQVNYGTVHLNVSEVVEYTEPEPDNGWERMGKGFMQSLKDLGNGIKEFFIFLVVSLPYLVLIAAVAVVVILIIRRACKKRKQKKQKAE